MHVDSFFEYLLGKPHVYWTQVPSPNAAKSDSIRDGVSAEEDLALRALLPETRPKRGRKKAEDREPEEDLGKSPAQRRRLDSPPNISEDFMIARSALITETPNSAHPGFHQSFDDPMVPWSATEVRGSLNDSFRWTQPNEAQTPMSAYPRSAVTPSTRTQMWSEDGSQSAITPNKSRQRRRHGPGVSSAWTGNTSSTSGKPRGRPPSNRSVTDGPFSTFPANPGSRDVPTINLHDDEPIATPVAGNSNVPYFFPPNMTINSSNQPDSAGQNNRPSRLGLQLQVPQRQGGDVRLATPPPVVLLNGKDDSSTQHNSSMPSPSKPASHLVPSQAKQVPSEAQMTPHSQITSSSQHFTPMMEYFNTPSTGDPDTNFQSFVSIAFRQNEDADRTNVDALESHFICEILAADWYDVNGMSIERCGIDEAAKICKQVVKNLQSESSSTEAFLINLSALAGGPLMTRLRMTKMEMEGMTSYECHWKMRFGSIEGDFTIRATVERSNEQMVADAVNGDGEASWKQRCMFEVLLPSINVLRHCLTTCPISSNPHQTTRIALTRGCRS
jgi:hypothetical protein